jgi:chaperonin GroEL (HSP60 family)
LPVDVSHPGRYFFVEDCKNPHSCTILIKGPNEHTIAQLKDAVRDGMRAVLNAIEDCTVLPGAGAFEVACHKSLTDYAHSTEVTGKVKLGVLAFAEAMLVIPKTLAENSGFDMSVSVAFGSMLLLYYIVAAENLRLHFANVLICLSRQEAPPSRHRG